MTPREQYESEHRRSARLQVKADKAQKLAHIEYIIERIDHRLAWAEANSMPHDLPDMVHALVAHIRGSE